jgi:hypothetical protein
VLNSLPDSWFSWPAFSSSVIWRSSASTRCATSGSPPAQAAPANTASAAAIPACAFHFFFMSPPLPPAGKLG